MARILSHLSRRTAYHSIFVIFLFLLIYISAACNSKPSQQADLLDGTAEYYLDTLVLGELTEKIAAGEFGKLTSMLIVKNDSLAYEEYFRGMDSNSLHEIQSVTKSFSSALIGIAVKEGFIENIEQPVLGFFPEYEEIANMSERKERMTLEHVLQMRAGFTWDEWSVPYLSQENQVRAMMSHSDWIKYVLDLPMASEPGTAYCYNTGASMLLAGVIKNMSGQSPGEFGVEYLFEPLGIETFEWPTYSNGLNPTGFGLRLRSRDMAKFGLLYLNNGIVNGDTILTSDWIAKSIGHYSQFSDGGYYGYQWWIMPSSGKISQDYIPYAVGWGIQHIVFISNLNMVIVITGEDWEQEYWPLRTILYDYIFRAIRNL